MSPRVSLFFANLNKYTISKIPTVLRRNIAINQYCWSDFTLLQRAKSFQKVDQRRIANRSAGGSCGKKFA